MMHPPGVRSRHNTCKFPTRTSIVLEVRCAKSPSTGSGPVRKIGIRTHEGHIPWASSGGQSRAMTCLRLEGAVGSSQSSGGGCVCELLSRRSPKIKAGNLHTEPYVETFQSFGVEYKSNAACDRVTASLSPASGAVLLCIDWRWPCSCFIRALISGSSSS